jgi:uncharacterized membrane protein
MERSHQGQEPRKALGDVSETVGQGGTVVEQGLDHRRDIQHMVRGGVEARRFGFATGLSPIEFDVIRKP